MKFEDIIGFIISFGALLLVIFQAVFSRRPQIEEPPVIIKEKFVPPPLPRSKKRAAVLPPEPDPVFESAPSYEVMGKKAPSRAHRLMRTLKSRRESVILREIIGPPKCI